MQAVFEKVQTMTGRGYNIAIGAVVILLICIVGWPYERPYVEDFVASITGADVPPDAPARHPEKFEGLYKAGRAIGAATDVGVNILRYRELLGTLATEFEIADDSIKDRVDRDVLAGYGRALEKYKAAGEAWQQKIKSNGSDEEMQNDWHDARIRLEAANARVHPRDE